MCGSFFFKHSTEKQHSLLLVCGDGRMGNGGHEVFLFEREDLGVGKVDWFGEIDFYPELNGDVTEVKVEEVILLRKALCWR